MNKASQTIDIELLASGLGKIFHETVIHTLQKEIASSVKLKDDFISSLNDFERKSAKAISNKSAEALLYENARFCNTIMSMLDKDDPREEKTEITDLLTDFFDQSYRFMEIIPESRILEAQIRKIWPAHLTKTRLLTKAKKLLARTRNKYIKSFKSVDDDSSLSSYSSNPNRNFLFLFLVIDNISSQLELYEKLLHYIVKLRNKLWDIDKRRLELFKKVEIPENNERLNNDRLSIDFNEEDLHQIISEIESTGDQIIEKFSTHVNEFLQVFDDGKKIQYDNKSGEINIVNEANNLKSKIKKLWEGWFNTRFLLTEDWMLELEINSLRFHILKEYYNFSNDINNNFTIPVRDILHQIRETLVNLKSKLDHTKIDNETGFDVYFRKAKLEFKRQTLFKSIPLLKESIMKSDIPKAIDNIEISSFAKFNSISKKRYLIKHPDYNRPIPRSEFESISPHELLSYEMMPGLRSVFPDLKSSFIHHVQVFEEKATEIPEIIEFAIESSVAFFEKENKADESVKVSKEGLIRSENKLNELEKIHENFISQEVNKLKESIEQFINEINTITDSESSQQIKIRIAKLKAIEKSKAIRTKTLNQITNFLPVLKDYTKSFITFLRKSSEKISKTFIIEDQESFISSDISDYLTATEQAIDKLPFIYQRLFRFEPLTSFELYIDRKEPMEKFKLAYSKWKDSKFAPVVIIGEKGSGKTSFINRFLKSNIQNEKVLSIDLQSMNKDPEGVYEEIKSNVDSVYNPSLQKETGKDNIIIIDGLERLFRARIGGFNYLLKTMQLISETHKQIFWIVSCHLYSWIYMDKAIKLSDYFGYHIKLTELKPDQLQKIIERRHNISGFSIIFEPGITKKGIVNIRKVRDINVQIELKGDYFKSLTELNKSNIYQAFLYWLRSTTQLKDDTLFVKQISEVGNNFIKSVSRPKMITLRNILIHNGITLEGHHKIFKGDLEDSKLHLDQMLDDGLIVKTMEYYYINPLIYTQVISEMYNQNLLH